MQTTSLQAFENKKPTIKTDQDKILSVLSKQNPLTYNEIAWRLGWFNPNKASRRLPELLRLHKIAKKGVKMCTRAKSNCSAYILL